MPTRQTIHQLHLTTTRSPLLTKAWHSHPCKIQNGLKHRTLSGCIILFISIHFRYANLHYPSYLRITHQVGVLKALLYHYHSLRLILTGKTSSYITLLLSTNLLLSLPLS